jgi:hypothetical protein
LRFFIADGLAFNAVLSFNGAMGNNIGSIW